VTDERSPTEPVRLGFSGADRAFLGVVGVVLGAAAGWVLPILVHWAVDQGLPLPGWLTWLDTVDAGWLSWGRPMIGAVAGFVIAMAIVEQSPTVIVDPAELVVDQGSNRRRIPRDSVVGVYREGGKTVVETAEGRRLFEGEIEGGREHVRQAFLDRGWPYESESR
jgi:hypothetical protein